MYCRLLHMSLYICLWVTNYFQIKIQHYMTQAQNYITSVHKKKFHINALWLLFTLHNIMYYKIIFVSLIFCNILYNTHNLNFINGKYPVSTIRLATCFNKSNSSNLFVSSTNVLVRHYLFPFQINLYKYKPLSAKLLNITT